MQGNDTQAKQTLKWYGCVAIVWMVVVGLTPSLAMAQEAVGSLRDAKGTDGIVVAVSPDGAQVGAAILERGGNAVDSAIATAFALAVTHPAAGNIGGGGFMLIAPSDGSPPMFIDYREKAPLSSTPEMYIDGGSRKNHRYVGVPGTVRGLKLAHEIYGMLDWSDLLMPAIGLARDGFPIHAGLASSLNGQVQNSNNAEFKRVFGKPGGREWTAGDRLAQPDLANTLQRIADHGNAGFYNGETAELLVSEMVRGGGYVTREDLSRYRARVRNPIHFSYRDFEVYSAPLPSSGGITLSQMMGMAEQFDLNSAGRWSARTSHVMIESMRRAYAHRAQHLGDSDFVEIPSHLATKDFACELASSIDLDKATKSDALGPKVNLEPTSDQTTHFSVIDGAGMAVSNTYTLEASYGSGVVVTGAGFILNNEMGDFNSKPGRTSRGSHIGTPANDIRPEKRMLSSMTPTIVTKDKQVYLVTGSPGGRTIINTVFCVTLNVLEFDMTARQAVDAPRMDHEWFPEPVVFMGMGNPQYEKLVAELTALGHDMKPSRGQGDANTILVKGGVAYGAADARFGAAVPARKSR